MVAPHRRDVSEIGGHALSIDGERKIGGEDVFPDAIAVEPRGVGQGVDELMRERMQQHVHERGQFAGHPLPLLVLVPVEELTEILVSFEIALSETDIVGRHIGDPIFLQPTTHASLVQLDVEGLVLLLGHIDGAFSVLHPVEGNKANRHGDLAVLILALIDRRGRDPGEAETVFTDGKATQENHLRDASLPEDGTDLFPVSLHLLGDTRVLA